MNSFNAPAVSQELVPVATQRRAWNQLHGFDLPHHNEFLAAEQARRINEHYEIVAYFGAHGVPRREGPPATPKQLRYDLSHLPTTLEYEEAAKVVDGLQPWDILFVEELGFREQPSLQLMSKAVRLELHEEIAIEKAKIEDLKIECKISAWEYAAARAWHNGIMVVRADLDLFDLTSILTMAGKSLEELWLNLDADPLLKDRLDSRRDRRGPAIIKDLALRYLPPEGAPMPECRRKLALLFGINHKDRMLQTFNDFDITVALHDLQYSDVVERATEHIRRLQPHIASLIMANSRG